MTMKKSGLSVGLSVARISTKINDARQLLTLVGERPAVKKTGDRATLIAYSELRRLEVLLKEAVAMLAAEANEKIKQHYDEQDKQDGKPEWPFVLPMGAPKRDDDPICAECGMRESAHDGSEVHRFSPERN